MLLQGLISTNAPAKRRLRTDFNHFRIFEFFERVTPVTPFLTQTRPNTICREKAQKAHQLPRKCVFPRSGRKRCHQCHRCQHAPNDLPLGVRSTVRTAKHVAPAKGFSAPTSGFFQRLGTLAPATFRARLSSASHQASFMSPALAHICKRACGAPKLWRLRCFPAFRLTFQRENQSTEIFVRAPI